MYTVNDTQNWKPNRSRTAHILSAVLRRSNLPICGRKTARAPFVGIAAAAAALSPLVGCTCDAEPAPAVERPFLSKRTAHQCDRNYRPKCVELPVLQLLLQSLRLCPMPSSLLTPGHIYRRHHRHHSHNLRCQCSDVARNSTGDDRPRRTPPSTKRPPPQRSLCSSPPWQSGSNSSAMRTPGLSGPMARQCRRPSLCRLRATAPCTWH